MDLLNRIARFLSPRRRTAERYIPLYVQCQRCGEKIRARVDLWNELSPDYEDGTLSYFSRKVLMGSGICFQQIEVRLRFDANRKLVDQEVSGGGAIDADEFEAGQ